ncbi:hypothetical protein SEA_NANOSMITE_39 [Mycobacterium phage Nanosmite]|nr:hypothetical protein SEA_NANOSMITE_39 [Mycobacterium phage Nanosmite]
MGSFKPLVPVRSNRPLELQRGNPLRYRYTLPGNREFPVGTTALLTVANTYGQTVGAYTGVVLGKDINFTEAAAISDALRRTDSWQLFVTYPSETMPTLLEQGQVIRIEAPFPDAPPQSSEFDGVSYQYSFGTPGRLYDPAWRVLAGSPFVHDNSARSLPNAVAAGTLIDDLTLWPKVAMLWFAPLQTDAVRLTYNIVRENDGIGIAVICSNYDMTNWVGIAHKQVFGVGSWDDDQLQIVTGTGPTTYAVRVTQDYDSADLSNFTAEYNPITNTYSVYLGESHTPLLSWIDTTNVVNHGEGERYVGFAFESALLSPGVEVSDWIIADTP